jgi:hypothetical protein
MFRMYVICRGQSERIDAIKLPDGDRVFSNVSTANNLPPRILARLLKPNNLMLCTRCQIEGIGQDERGGEACGGHLSGAWPLFNSVHD